MKSLPLSLPKMSAEQLNFFRYGYFGEDVLLSNDAGEWLFVDQADFSKMLLGNLEEENPKYQELQKKGFLRDGLDLEELAQRVRRKKAFLKKPAFTNLKSV